MGLEKATTRLKIALFGHLMHSIDSVLAGLRYRIQLFRSLTPLQWFHNITKNHISFFFRKSQFFLVARDFLKSTAYMDVYSQT